MKYWSDFNILNLSGFKQIIRILGVNKGIILLIIFLFFVLHCAHLPQSVGKARDVVVVASLIDTTFILNNIQLYNFVPQKESTFFFIYADDTSLKKVNQFHSLFLYGTLKDEFINTLLSSEARESVRKDTFNLFKINNLWAKEQTVVILAASQPQYLQPGILKYRRMISKILEENYYARIKESYYEKGIDKNIGQKLSRFGIEMDFPKGWLIDSTYKNENFIFIHAHYPDRSIFFLKEKLKYELNDTIAIKIRDLLTKKYYNGDYILKELTTAEKIEFKEMKGIRMKGVWQNDSLVAGGPFITYFLIKGDSLYIVDGMLFLPGERKTDYFTTLEVIMNSFKITKRKS